MLKISEFQLKDVVNVADGKKLGNVGDIDIDLTTGKIQAVIIGGSRVLGFFGKDDEIVRGRTRLERNELAGRAGRVRGTARPVCGAAPRAAAVAAGRCLSR